MTTQHDSGDRAFDWTPALAFFEGDAELLRDVLEAFLEECPVLMQTMDESIDRLDVPPLQRAAHIMAGALRIFGIEPAIDSAARLEELARANQLARARELYTHLKQYIDVLLPAATAFVQERRQA